MQGQRGLAVLQQAKYRVGVQEIVALGVRELQTVAREVPVVAALLEQLRHGHHGSHPELVSRGLSETSERDRADLNLAV